MSRLNRLPYFYGWNIVFTLAISATVSYGILFYAFSVFVKPMEEALAWNRSEIYVAFSLSILTSALFTIPIGIYLDRFGARWLMMFGSIIGTLLILAWSQVQSLLIFYLIWIAIGATTAILFYDPCFVVISNWFLARRGLALTILTLVAGFASTIFLPLSEGLIQAHGWREALIVLALILCLGTFPLNVFIIRHRPSDMNLFPDGASHAHTTDHNPAHIVSLRAVFAGPAFWLMTLSFGLALFGATVIRSHIVPLLIENGFDSGVAAWAGGIIGAAQVGGRLIFIPFERWIPVIYLTPIIFILHGAAIFFLLFKASFPALLAFVILFGAAHGAMTLCRPLLLAQNMDPAIFGRANSLMSTLILVSVAAAPLISSLIYEVDIDYQPVMYLSLICLFLASFLGFCLTFISHKTRS
ncbi:MFS transporter [Anaerolineales bacterium]